MKSDMGYLWKKTAAFCLMCVIVLTMAAPTQAVTKKVALSATKKTICVGQSFSLQLNNASKKGKITWKTSKKKVASVTAKGKVTGKSKGTASITATYKKKKYTCKVTVKNIAVTGVLLNTTSLRMITGDTYQLVPIVKPSNATDQTVIYTSSKPEIVSVDDKGTIRSRMPGDAMITAKCGSKTASCRVVVYQAVPISGITISQSTLSVTKGYTATLVAEIKPYNASVNDLIWMSDTPQVASVTATGGTATIKGESKGTATITVKEPNGTYMASCVVTVNNPAPVTEVKIYPRGNAAATASYSMSKAQTVQMEAVVLPTYATDAKVTWSLTGIDAGKYANIDANGLLTAKEVGTVAVYATADGAKSNEITITIKEKEPVTSITAVSNVTVVEGKTTEIIASAQPSNASFRQITAVSSNPAIATVAVADMDATGNCKVTVRGVAEGSCSAILTADGVAKTILITVEKSVDVSAFTITGTVNEERREYKNGDSVTVKVKAAAAFKYELEPKDANQTVEWKVVQNLNPLAAPILPVITEDTAILTGIRSGTADLNLMIDGVTKATIHVVVSN